MTHDPEATDSAEFKLRRRTHENLTRMQAAMREAGISSIAIAVTGGHANGAPRVDRDMDWQYDRDPEDVSEGVVTCLGRDGASRDPMTIREAAGICARDVMETLEGDRWAETDSWFKVVIPAEGLVRTAGAVRGPDGPMKVDNALRAEDPMAGLLGREPVLRTDRGDWYELESSDMARSATMLGRTAVVHFYGALAGDRPVVKNAADKIAWFTLVEHDGADSRAVVTLAAQDAASHDGDRWPQIGHVTGYANADAFFTYEEEIAALAERRGLHVEPNHMGSPLERPENDEEMEP